MSINRWNMRAVVSTVDIEKSPSGMYVKYEDYAEEISAIKAQLDEGRKLANDSYEAACIFKAQRDELLAELKEIRESWKHVYSTYRRDEIKSAIANAEGHNV